MLLKSRVNLKHILSGIEIISSRKLLSIKSYTNNESDNQAIRTTTILTDVLKPQRFTEMSTNNVTQFKRLQNNRNCSPPAIDEFPPDGFTRKQRREGWLTIHVLLTLYCFWFLAIICDDYFVPAIDSLCSSKIVQLFSCNFFMQSISFIELQMKEDVAGATFMVCHENFIH